MRLAIAVGIAVAVAAMPAAPFVAHAQTSAGAPAGTVAESPAVKRLTELLVVVNRGDAAAMRAYLDANSVDRFMAQSRGTSMLLPLVLDLHRLSHGLDLVRVTTIGTQQIQPQYRGT